MPRRRALVVRPLPSLKRRPYLQTLPSFLCLFLFRACPYQRPDRSAAIPSFAPLPSGWANRRDHSAGCRIEAGRQVDDHPSVSRQVHTPTPTPVHRQGGVPPNDTTCNLQYWGCYVTEDLTPHPPPPPPPPPPHKYIHVDPLSASSLGRELALPPCLPSCTTVPVC